MIHSIAIIAEKPSVAREIATLVGADQRRRGFLEGNGYKVTWAYGHLIELAAPAAYGYNSFNRKDLPMLPVKFQYSIRQTGTGKEAQTDKSAADQLKVIQQVFDSCSEIIVATDAGREGELIFRYIYNYLQCTKPFKRLWISSLTDKAIRQGLQNLRPGTEYDRLYQAGKCRSEADWRIGMNATQAITIASGGYGVRSLGRVQTPVLRMICDRFLENKDFVPQKYWQLQLQTQSGEQTFTANSIEHWQTESAAQSVSQQVLAGHEICVRSIECKEIQQEPPLLFDLTALQKEANTRYSYSAETTLNIAQKLYEAKLITYPRTGSRYIPEDVYQTIPTLMKVLARHTRFGEYASRLERLYHRCVDDSKVTDHHALIITENLPENLSTDEQKIYDLIAGRMLEAFSDKCIKDVTTVILNGREILFEAKGAITKHAGWRAVYGSPTKGEQSSNPGETEERTLPPLTEGTHLPVQEINIQEKETKPKPLYTEASLLAAMETAGKELEDEELRAAMKHCGLGTPATRAAIIETLFKRNYIVRQKKSLIPTENGLAVYRVVKDLGIANVRMTGKWENALSKIESGVVPVEKFEAEIIKYTRQITEELLSCQIAQQPNSTRLRCPKCGQQSVRIFPKAASCGTEGCDFVVFRNVSNKTLTETQVTDLITKGKTGLIKGLVGKSGKAFSASLKLNQDFKVVFDFDLKQNKLNR